MKKLYYARMYVSGGFADMQVESLDISKLRIPKDVFRVSFREVNVVTEIVNGKERQSQHSTNKNDYYIGEIVTKQDILNGKISKDHIGYNWLANGVRKELLLTAKGKLFTFEKNGIVLSPSDFDENGYYIGKIDTTSV